MQANNWKQRTQQLGKKKPRSLHPYPIKQVFYSRSKQSIFRGYLRLRCFQPLSPSAQLPGNALSDNRSTRDADNSFLSYWSHLPLRLLTHPLDSNQPVSRRSKPSSRSPLMGEQPHPWVLLHTQDGKNRHRSSKPQGRYGLLPATTQLSPRQFFCHLRPPSRRTLRFARPGFRL